MKPRAFFPSDSPVGTLVSFNSKEGTTGTLSSSAHHEVFECRICGSLVTFNGRTKHQVDHDGRT